MYKNMKVLLHQDLITLFTIMTLDFANARDIWLSINLIRLIETDLGVNATSKVIDAS